MKRNFLRKRNCNPGLLENVRMEGRLESSRARRARPAGASKKYGTIKRRVILSVSDDLDFDKGLRIAALQRGQIVIRVESVEAALRIVETECSGVILLDLDFVGKAAWELAGSLLQDPQCPPVILLTGQGEQSDLRMSVFVGSIFQKSDDAEDILNIVRNVLEMSFVEKARRSTAQRGIFRELVSGREPAPLIPTRRFWGINE